MSGQPSLLFVVWLGGAVVGLGLLVLLALLMRRARAQRRRPVWRRMVSDMDYFREALAALFQAQGYVVQGHWLHQDPADETPREVVFALERAGTRYAALCVRWLVPVTSEVVGRFERALATTQAHVGLLVTTSDYTQAALDRAQGLPVELYDRTHVQRWLAQAWP